MPDKLPLLCRVDIQRINGDVYINGIKKIFAVDAGQNANPTFDEVDWLIGWVKIGLASKGHTVPHFPAGRKDDVHGSKRDTSAL